MKKGPIFKIIRVLVVLGVAATLAWALVEFKPPTERRPVSESGRLVEVVRAASAPVTLSVESYGTVQPRNTLKLVAEVRGQIVRHHPGFEEGGFVEKGADLIVIDPRDYALAVESRNAQIHQTNAELERLAQEERNLEATLRIARNDVSLAASELDRLRNLVGRNVVAQSVVDQTEQKYLASLERRQSLENQKALFGPRRELLRAQRRMTQVTLRQAELNLERTRIRAPFDGWVLEKSVEVGQHVNVGQVAGAIYAAGALEIEVRIPVKDLKWLPMPFTEQNPLKAQVVFEDSGDSHSWPARVIRQKAQMEATTRMLTLVVAVDGAAGTAQQDRSLPLKPGMFVTVKIAGRAVENAFVLPRHFVYPGDVIYTVVEDRLNIKKVQVLRAYRDQVVVAGGITDGDLIIRTPLSAATEGMRVRIKQ